MSVTEDGGSRGRRRRLVLGAGAVGLAVVAAGTTLAVRDGEPTADPSVTWGGSEGRPSCVYDPRAGTVEATLRIEGVALRPATVTVTVTAYADENTSRPVGSGSRSMDVEGSVDTRLVVAFAVDRAPHVDVDGETACSLSVAS